MNNEENKLLEKVLSKHRGYNEDEHILNDPDWKWIKDLLLEMESEARADAILNQTCKKHDIPTSQLCIKCVEDIRAEERQRCIKTLERERQKVIDEFKAHGSEADDLELRDFNICIAKLKLKEAQP